MSKKNFSGGLDSLLGEKPQAAPTKKGRGRPVTQLKEVTNEAERGTLEGETRATFIIKKELPEKLKAIAFWERTLIKHLVNKALEEVVAKYEKKNGKVKPIPNK